MRRQTIWLAVIGVAVCVVPSAVMGARPKKGTQERYVAGFHVFDKWSYPLDDGSAKPLVTAVWYPASRTRKKPYHKYCKGVEGLAVQGALPLPDDKNRPTIIFTHDFGGSAIDAVYLMESLARSGYVVVAADHNDAVSSLRITGPGQTDAKTVMKHRSAIFRRGVNLGRDAYAYRMLELKTVIDKILAESKDTDSPLAGMIDPNRIGVLAHGLGGYAAMSMMGMSADHTDKRIKVAVLYSPTVAMWDAEELYDLGGPVMFMYGQKEEQLRRQLPAPAAIAYETVLGPKWSVELKLAHGMTVCNTATIAAAALPSQKATVYAQHKMIGRYVGAMFHIHIGGLKITPAQFQAAAKQDAKWIKSLKMETTRLPRPEPVEDESPPVKTRR